MKANIKSTHAKLYEFTYTSNLPKNLCPYFWKLVIAVLLFIPNFIVQIPSLLIDLFTKPDEWEDCYDRRCKGMAAYFVLILLLIIIMVETNFFKATFGAYSYDQFFANFGLVSNVMGLFFLLRFLWLKYIRYWKLFEREYKEPTPSIITEFVKAKYHKYCPTIEWESDKSS